MVRDSDSTSRLAYAESKVAFFEREVGPWLRDHCESPECQQFEDVIRDISALLQDLFRLDIAVQAAYLQDVPGSGDVQQRLLGLFARWLTLARIVEKNAVVFTTRGFDVEGLANLRDGLFEVESLLVPVDEIPAAMASLRDEAVASDARGDTTEGLRD